MKGSYEIGSITRLDHWTELRCALGTLCNGALTPSITTYGNQRHVVSIRAAAAQLQWIAGWFNGAAFAWGASALQVFPIVTKIG
jgi:hypothetical protein